ncbi:MAG: TMEM165/GDT1 family protein [Gammaproteobacteria bacterium]
MDMKTFLVVFGTVFLAELGDKTQLATLLYAADGNAGRWNVFAAAALALVVSTAIAVLAGSLVGKYLPTRYLHIAAGIGFIAVGAWTLMRA